MPRPPRITQAYKGDADIFLVADKVAVSAGLKGNNPGPTSATGVRFADGTAPMGTSDLGSGGFGQGWGFARAWTNTPGYAGGSSAGSGQVVSDLPYLETDSAGTVVLISDGTTAKKRGRGHFLAKKRGRGHFRERTDGRTRHPPGPRPRRPGGDHRGDDGCDA